jgi:hypothetical protein
MLPALTQDELTSQLRVVVETAHSDVAVTLVNGDIMVGRAMPQRVPYDTVGRKPFAYRPERWGPVDDPQNESALWLKDVELAWPSESKSDVASVCRLTADAIFALSPLGWKLDVAVPAVAGPLAQAIHEANERVARAAGIRIYRLVSASLRPTHKAEAEGIWFESYEPLYIDYDYFQRLSTLEVSVAVPGFEAQYSRGIAARAKAALTGNWGGTAVRPALPIVRESGHVELSPEDIATEMEGVTWRLAVLLRASLSLRGELRPILFKSGAVQYPLELWSLIRSPVTVCAEERQIPIRAGDHQWSSALIARAIGYVA